MKILRHFLPILLAGILALPAAAEDSVTLGGDTYASGPSAVLEKASPRDAFVSGFSASVTGEVSKDAHLVGFSVKSDAPVGADLYLAGFSVNVQQAVGEDLSAAGFSVDVQHSAAISGNARLAGGSVTVSAPVEGSLVVTAGTLRLDAEVSGDVIATAGDITFGPKAKIDGRLTYRAPKEATIPEGVIESTRVSFEKLTFDHGIEDLRKTMEPTVTGFWPALFGMFFSAVFALAFLIVLAAILLALAAEPVERLRRSTIARPWSSIGFGIAGLAMLIGLVPVLAMTLVGIPLVPILVVAIAIAWTLGYMLGAYALAWRVITAFRTLPETLLARLLVFAAGVIALSVLNFVPVVGWLINLAVLYLGLGALTLAVFETASRRIPPVAEEPTPSI